MRMQIRSLALFSGLRIQICCELWCSSQTQLRSCVAVAVAPIQPLAWELPYAVGVALKRQPPPKKPQKTKPDSISMAVFLNRGQANVKMCLYMQRGLCCPVRVKSKISKLGVTHLWAGWGGELLQGVFCISQAPSLPAAPLAWGLSLYGTACFEPFNKNNLEFLLWLSGLRFQHSVCKDASLVPGLSQWVKVWLCRKLQPRSQVWLRSGVAMAVVYPSDASLIQPLVQELP